MFFNTLFILSILSFVAAIPQDVPEAFTVIRQVKVLTDVAPFIVTSTTVLTFTPSQTTSITNPTGSGV
ncbi:hypothetical protein B0H19DRAFT_1261265 [Mycena capillaripes]|nr:hypothetical protein B0H19DRAFT_1261265 [Mycena capillaripes]